MLSRGVTAGTSASGAHAASAIVAASRIRLAARARRSGLGLVNVGLLPDLRLLGALQLVSVQRPVPPERESFALLLRDLWFRASAR